MQSSETARRRKAKTKKNEFPNEDSFQKHIISHIKEIRGYTETPINFVTNPFTGMTLPGTIRQRSAFMQKMYKMGYKKNQPDLLLWGSEGFAAVELKLPTSDPLRLGRGAQKHKCWLTGSMSDEAQRVREQSLELSYYSSFPSTLFAGFATTREEVYEIIKLITIPMKKKPKWFYLNFTDELFPTKALLSTFRKEGKPIDGL